MDGQEHLIESLLDRAKTIRGHVVRMSHQSGFGHPGPALSCVDIVTALYFAIMRIDPTRPDWPDRDRFIMSKGHGCAAWYAALAERGYFGTEELATWCQVGSRLHGHPNMAKLPGIDMTSGSLGHGLSAGLGMAIGLRLDGRSGRVFVLLGDGEIQEGLVWEAVLTAPHFHVGNLMAIVDYNRFQSGGSVDATIPLEPLVEKWRAFGWSTAEVDGHDFVALLNALRGDMYTDDRPTVLIAHTTKGKGVSFMENNNRWHAEVPSEEQVLTALRELGLE